MATIPGDPYVYNVQQWLNRNYRHYTRKYNVIEENGKTGWNTIYALIRAFQIEIGITDPADNFGNGTVIAFNEYFKRDGKRPAIEQQANDDLFESNIYAIIQGTLICKGYSIGVASPTLHFYGGTGAAIKKLKQDAGLNDDTSEIPLNVMKALLSMDYFTSYDQSVRTQNIIKLQRYLNRNYENYIGIKPCDGVYARGTNLAMMLAIQAEEGISVESATGNCGETTKRCLPNLPYNGGYMKDGKLHGVSTTNQVYSTANINRFKILFNMALYFNGYGNGNISENLDTEAIRAFQKKYSIEVTGTANYTTWLSALISCGDTSRSAIACDCATLINEDNVSVLVNNGYKYIGRYLSGTIGSGASKALSTSELKTLFNRNIRLFPIHQGAANSVGYFTEANATRDAELAAQYAESLHLQFGAIIYFAVDCDVMDYQITSNIIPYFKKLYSEFMTKAKGKYRIGLYGTRNVCTRVANSGYACSSFVCDMSTGFSGNLGFPIPENWALDQFNTTKIYSGEKMIEIDKNGFSGQYKGISQEYSKAESEESLDSLNTNSNSFLLVNRSDNSIPVYESKEHYNWPVATYGTQYVTSGSVIGQIKSNDFYVFFGVTSPKSDTVHKVLFHDGTDVKMGFIDGNHIYPGTGENLRNANWAQRLDYQEPYSCLRYNPETNDYTLRSSSQNQEITINQPVVYFNAAGTYVGTLKKGDKIVINAGNTNNCGTSMPWCYRVDKIKFQNGEEKSEGYYVNTGLEYGASGTSRAWY